MNDENEKKNIMRALALFSQLGLNMACCVLIGVLVGKYLDKLLGTSPWMLLVFSVIGAGAAFKVLYDTAIKQFEKN